MRGKSASLVSGLATSRSSTPCILARLSSVNWSNAPQRDSAGGIGCEEVQPPVANLKKSSQGWAELSKLAGSSGRSAAPTGAAESAKRAAVAPSSRRKDWEDIAKRFLRFP